MCRTVAAWPTHCSTLVRTFSCWRTATRRTAAWVSSRASTTGEHETSSMMNRGRSTAVSLAVAVLVAPAGSRTAVSICTRVEVAIGVSSHRCCCCCCSCCCCGGCCGGGGGGFPRRRGSRHHGSTPAGCGCGGASLSSASGESSWSLSVTLGPGPPLPSSSTPRVKVVGGVAGAVVDGGTIGSQYTPRPSTSTTRCHSGSSSVPAALRHPLSVPSTRILPARKPIAHWNSPPPTLPAGPPPPLLLCDALTSRAAARAVTSDRVGSAVVRPVTRHISSSLTCTLASWMSRLRTTRAMSWASR